MDRFEQGLPDPQTQLNEPVDECANEQCRSEIYQGDQVWSYDGDLFCSGKCLAKAMGAIELTVG